MILEVTSGQRVFLDRREVALDAVQPGTIGRREHQSQVVLLDKLEDRRTSVTFPIVQHHVEPLLAGIPITKDAQQFQKLAPRLMPSKDAEEFVAPHIVRSQQVARFVGASIGGGQSANLSPECPVHAVMRTDLQRPELIQTDYPPAPRFRLPVATLDRFFLAA